MAITVGTNTYATLAEADSYHSARGNSAWGDATDTAKEEAMIRATQALDAMYRGRFQSYKTGGRAQLLEWPRFAVWDESSQVYVASDEIPQEIKDAECEAALRELAQSGSMLPDLERGGNVRRYKAGSVEIEYGAGATASTTFQIIDRMLGPLLSAKASNSLVGRAVRG